MVRKKNSEETAAVVQVQTRQTRQRRNMDEEGDADSTLVERPSKSSRTPKTPATRRRDTRKKNLNSAEDLAISTRSRKVGGMKNSSDSDIENNADESKSKMNRSELPGFESYPTRSRSKKDAAPAALKHAGVENGSDSEPKRVSKKKRVLASADNTLVEVPSPVRSSVKTTRSQAKSSATEMNPVRDPESLQIPNNARNSPADKKTAKISTLRRIMETPKKVSPRKRADPLIKPAPDTVTPESSPMLVNLTPHRSTKTPKKSPLNIGSPKTHSQSPLRQSKTPRKLTINVESPATSDKSSVSMGNQSVTELHTVRRDPYVVLTDFKKENLSPKVSELESPQKLVSSSKLRVRKSPQKSPAAASHLTVGQASPGKKSPGKRPAILASKIRRSPAKSPAGNRKPGLNTPARRQAAVHKPVETPMKLVENSTPESPRRPKSTVKKRSPVTSLGTPLRPVPAEPAEAKSAASGCKVAPKKINMMIKLEAPSPQITPRGRIRRSLHLTPDFVKLSRDSTSSPMPTPTPSGTASEEPNGLAMIIDESSELLDASNFMNFSEEPAAPADGTYELSEEPEQAGVDKEGENAEKTDVDDATYELAEPKTPSLKKQSKKRQLSNVEPDKSTPEAKKRCRVRFASPDRDKGVIQSPARLGRKSLPTVDTPAKRRIATRLAVGNGGVESSRRRSRSLTKIDQNTPASRIAAKRRSISASDLTSKTPKLNQSTQNSVNRLSRPRQSVNSEVKLDVKLPVPRRAPNFAQIHQKKFATMESLVDAKKRVAKRHEEHNALPVTRALHSSLAPALSETSAVQNSTNPAPSDAQNGQFNRFGFKLRKAEAMKVVTKKPAAASRTKNHQETNRSILKGVRTNRRFELQMKARNMKI